MTCPQLQQPGVRASDEGQLPSSERTRLTAELLSCVFLQRRTPTPTSSGDSRLLSRCIMAVWLEADRRARGRSVPRIDQLEEEAVVGGMWSQQNHVTDSKSTWRRLPASKRTRSPVYTRRLQLHVPCDFSPTAVRLRQYPGNLTITEPVVYYFANKSEKLLKWVDFFSLSSWKNKNRGILLPRLLSQFPREYRSITAILPQSASPSQSFNVQHTVYNMQLYTVCCCISNDLVVCVLYSAECWPILGEICRGSAVARCGLHLWVQFDPDRCMGGFRPNENNFAFCLRDAMRKRGLCRRKITGWMSVTRRYCV